VDLSGLRVGIGQEGMIEVATHQDAGIVVASAVGAVGLVPTYRALEAGKDVALANKETLVMAGALMLAQSKERGGRLLPIRNLRFDRHRRRAKSAGQDQCKPSFSP